MPTCIAGDSFQDARKTGQRSASPAVVHLQHGHVLISHWRWDHQIFHIPFMDIRNFIQPQFPQQCVLHILMGKSLCETGESGEKDTSPKEIHEGMRKNLRVTDRDTVAQEIQTVSL